MAALLASDEKAACAENPRVLGPEGEGGSGPVPPQRDKQLVFNLGSCLQEQEKIKILTMLETNVDRFAFSMEDIEPFKGEPMALELNSDKPRRRRRRVGEAKGVFCGGRLCHGEEGDQEHVAGANASPRATDRGAESEWSGHCRGE